jgi:nucleotide-binding universal stress UspA family protein
MGLKDLLVYVDESAETLLRLRLAVQLAKRHQSRLTALFVREWNEPQLAERKAAELGLMPAAEYESMTKRIKASIDHAAEALQSDVEGLGRKHDLKIDWCVTDGQASLVVPQHARYADLCILGHNAKGNGVSFANSFSEGLLFSSGCPVLLIPSNVPSEMLGAHVCIAWNASRPAARAVSDALHLIKRADRVTVLTANHEDLTARHGALPATKMIQHLERHGVSADLVEIIVSPDHSTAAALQAQALSVGADLLVAGAFGHPQLWEKMLGGTTRDLLDGMIMPTLMSN